MNRKQSHEPFGSHAQSYNSKTQYHPTSPYIELLEAKKKVYGYRYDTKNVKSFTNYIKPSPGATSSIFAPGPQPFKSVSTEKSKNNKSTIEKKKRTKTEQEEKMHESLFVYADNNDRGNEDAICKSLHYGEKKASGQFQPSSYFQQLSGQKNKRKRHLSQSKHSQSEYFNQALGAGLQNLQISDIDGLINLIDNCVNEANEYISYLGDKINTIREQLNASKMQVSELQETIYKKDEQINQRQAVIRKLQKQLSLKSSQQMRQSKKQNHFEVKNLLQIIEKISEENEKLRVQIQQYRSAMIKQKSNSAEKYNPKQKGQKAQFYNEINSKIDIFNISIESNPKAGSPADKRDREKEMAKKYKFLKSKGA